jgi:hypothetical protein
VVEAGNPAVGLQPEHLLGAVLAHVRGDALRSLPGAVEQVDLDVGAGRLGQFDRLVGRQRRHVAVDRQHRVVGPEQVGRRRPLGVVGAGDGPLAEQVVVGLAAALCDEALLRGDALLDARLDAVSRQ